MTQTPDAKPVESLTEAEASAELAHARIAHPNAASAAAHTAPALAGATTARSEA